MSHWHDALRAYRRRPLDAAPEAPKNAVFVLCSEHTAGAALATACDPALVLQAYSPSFAWDDAVAATLELAIEANGVRHVVVCGHSECTAVPRRGAGREAAQRMMLAQCERLLADERVGRMLRERGVSLRALWFDDADGDVYDLGSAGSGNPRLMGDEEFGAMLAGFAPCGVVRRGERGTARLAGAFEQDACDADARAAASDAPD